MPGWITFNRDFFDKDNIKSRNNTKIPWTVRAVLRELVWEARYEPTVFKGVQMQRGDVCISVETLCERLNLSPRSCRSALENLITNRQVTDKQPTNQPTNRSKFYHIENYDDIVIPENNRQTNRQVTDKQPTTYNRSKEVKEVPQMQLQIQDQKITPDGVMTNPVSELGSLAVAMGLPSEPNTFSWVGGLCKSFGPDTCKEIFSAQKLQGVTVSDFEGKPKNFKAYFTKAVQNRAKEIEVAAQKAAKPKWVITNYYDGSPMLEPEKRIREILDLWKRYPKLNHDPDRGKPGCTWAVPDEVVQFAIAEARKNGVNNETH